jgi:hypothetical protein
MIRPHVLFAGSAEERLAKLAKAAGAGLLRSGTAARAAF